MNVTLHKHFAKNTETGKKVRVFYGRGRVFIGPNGERGLFDAVTIYAKTCLDRMDGVFTGYKNDSECQSDYVVADLFRIYPGQPLWDKACELATR